LLFRCEGSDSERHETKNDFEKLQDIEDDPIPQETRSLLGLFQDFGFEGEIAVIPHRKPHHFVLATMARTIVKYDAADHLQIIYYGGHGAIDPESRGSIWHR
jgi:hypothetical protein